MSFAHHDIVCIMFVTTQTSLLIEKANEMLSTIRNECRRLHTTYPRSLVVFNVPKMDIAGRRVTCDHLLCMHVAEYFVVQCF